MFEKELFTTKIINPVACGFPSPAQDYIQQRISLDETYIKHPLASFFFEAQGESMNKAFIPNKANLLVDRSVNPKSGDIVVASLNGEFVAKFFKKKDLKCWLCSANSKFPDIEITEEMDVRVFGVVTTIIIDTNLLKQCML